jgi:hypothetical protein
MLSKPFYFLCFVGFLLCSCKKSNSPAANPQTGCSTVNKADAENIAVFPSSNAWNTAIDAAAKDSRSDAIINLISTSDPSIKTDFGSGLYNGVPIGIPYDVVCSSQSKVQISYRANGTDGNYGNESDAGPFPIPLNAAIEGNGTGDSHVIVVDVENKKLYELYNASKSGDHWEASSGALFDLNSNALRTDGWTSADAAGLPIFAGLVRYEEISKGTIDHAIRFTLRSSKVSKAYIDPARHKVNGSNASAAAPVPFGMRMRLKGNFDISGYSATNKIILTAMKKYGLMLADIGSDLYISGSPDSRWDNDDLRNLSKIKATDFEVVQMGTIH